MIRAAHIWLWVALKSSKLDFLLRNSFSNNCHRKRLWETLKKKTSDQSQQTIHSAMNQSELEAKSCNWCQARENMQPVSNAGKHASVLSAGKHATGAERGKNASVLSAGKRATGAKRGKTYNKHQARGHMQPVPSAEKHATTVPVAN